jgi:hypothetical protein
MPSFERFPTTWTSQLVERNAEQISAAVAEIVSSLPTETVKNSLPSQSFEVDQLYGDLAKLLNKYKIKQISDIPSPTESNQDLWQLLLSLNYVRLQEAGLALDKAFGFDGWRAQERQSATALLKRVSEVLPGGKLDENVLETLRQKNKPLTDVVAVLELLLKSYTESKSPSEKMAMVKIINAYKDYLEELLRSF